MQECIETDFDGVMPSSHHPRGENLCSPCAVANDLGTTVREARVASPLDSE
jgi:hypothetical protein